MIKMTPLVQTKFIVPTGQRKNIYSPLQKLYSKYKLTGEVKKDTIELSTYNREHAGIVQKTLEDLQANFIMKIKESE